MAKNRYSAKFAEADAVFNGIYKDEIVSLLGLSKDEIESITPGNAELKTYSVLIKIVEKASKDNLSQAQLIKNIRDLGELAVKIAKKVPSLATLL